METKIIEGFSFGIILWEITLIILLVILIYFLVKFYRKINMFLDLRIEQMKNEK